MNRVTARPATGSPQRCPAATALSPANPPAAAQLVRGHDLVADDPQDGAGDADAHVGGAAVTEQLAHAFEAGEGGADPDDQGDADPGQVLGPLPAVRVALGRPAAGHAEAGGP